MGDDIWIDLGFLSRYIVMVKVHRQMAGQSCTMQVTSLSGGLPFEFAHENRGANMLIGESMYFPLECQGDADDVCEMLEKICAFGAIEEWHMIGRKRVHAICRRGDNGDILYDFKGRIPEHIAQEGRNVYPPYTKMPLS